MRYSQLFTKTSKTVSAEEVAKNAQLLLRAGFIHKEMAGVYAYLPLGLRVFEKIKNIVREEMNALGSQELTMTSLQPKEVWEQTDRWDDEKVDVWFKSKLKNGTEVGFGWSHEEPITTMMKEFVSSYRDLPFSVYQFQNKLRNETRAKSGIMRTREFVMKDMYTYTKTEAELTDFYDATTQTYLKIFSRVGLGDVTYLTAASGGAFTQFSHEFQTVVEAGEDTIYIDREKKVAINEEVYTDEVISQLGLNKDTLEKVRAAEVGNIFNFGTTKSEQIGLYFQDENGERKPVYLSSYGIGIGRLMGVVVEYFADEKGLVWPAAIAPYTVYVALLGKDDSTRATADALYSQLVSAGVEVFYDDREESAGAKLADADLMGMPVRVVVSEKSLAAGGVEVKKRTEAESQIMSEDELVKFLKG
ncbi:MAG: aminoacyl--tRNA ligase-related protein [Patescibacteria group bacterium]